MNLKVSDFPDPWQAEYETLLNESSQLEGSWGSSGLFAIGKIAAAFHKALNEISRGGVNLGLGSWGFDFLPAAECFFQPEVLFLPLDYRITFDEPQTRAHIAAVSPRRPVVPIVWAHHDDHSYVGRPFTPFSQFAAKLAEARSAGFGIIHWTTRPLDIYFKSLSKQVWLNSKNEPLHETCAEMAERSFRRFCRDVMTEYLHRWVTAAPIFGRETTSRFIDRPLRNPKEVIAGCQRRLEMLDQVDEASLDPASRNRLNYFRLLELFMTGFYRAQVALERSTRLTKDGDLAGARKALADCRPEAVIKLYARLSRIGGITRGEQGLIVSLNLRWLPFFVGQRQLLGMEAIRYNFGPTQHDPLAQGAGRETFYFDAGRDMWKCLGERETGAQTFVIPGSCPAIADDVVADNTATLAEICRTGVESDHPLTIHLTTITGERLLPGKYSVHLFFCDPRSTRPGERVFDLSLETFTEFEVYRFHPVTADYLRILCHGNSDNDWNSISEVSIPSLDTSAAGPPVVSSTALPHYPASHTLDEKMDTRWAAFGEGEWPQYRLRKDVETDEIKIAWYKGHERKATFDILVSDEGRKWSKVRYNRCEGVGGLRERIDVFERVHARCRILRLNFPVEIRDAGGLTITLRPVKGKSLICGVVVDAEDHGDREVCPRHQTNAPRSCQSIPSAKQDLGGVRPVR